MGLGTGDAGRHDEGQQPAVVACAGRQDDAAWVWIMVMIVLAMRSEIEQNQNSLKQN